MARLDGRKGQTLVLACVLGCGVGAASTFPTWLGDFNLLVGGPEYGHRISVIGEDWGQDVNDVGALAVAQGWERVAYYTKFPLRREELESFGLEVEKIGCKDANHGSGVVIIHIDDWVRQTACFAWLRDKTPTYVVNHHLLVFAD